MGETLVTTFHYFIFLKKNFYANIAIMAKSLPYSLQSSIYRLDALQQIGTYIPYQHFPVTIFLYISFKSQMVNKHEFINCCCWRCLTMQFRKSTDHLNEIMFFCVISLFVE